VDDDPAVLDLLQLTLRLHGFTVQAAHDGQQALDVYRLYREAIDLVLLDVSLPGLDGPQTFAALRQFNPALRCYFMRGCPRKYTSQELLALGGVGVLDKPFEDLTEFSRVLRQVIS